MGSKRNWQVIIHGIVLIAAFFSATGVHALPDSGNLTAMISLREQRDGSVRIHFNETLQERWGDELNDDVGLAVVELMIFRKLFVESTLGTLQHIRRLLTHLSHPVDDSEIFPEELRSALSMAYDDAKFPAMHLEFIRPLEDPIATFEATPFSEEELKSYWTSMLWQSVALMQRQTMIARFEQDSGADENLQRVRRGEISEEQAWALSCNLSAREIRQSGDVSQRRQLRNQNAKLILTRLDGVDFNTERLLYAPVNILRKYNGNRRILRDVNSIRPIPGEKTFLANVVTALALQDAQELAGFQWRTANGNKSRSELLCTNWDEIPFEDIAPEFFDRHRQELNQALAIAARDRIEEYHRALFWLLQLSQSSLVQKWGLFPKSWDEYEIVPEHPQELLDKFVEILPVVSNSPVLQEQMRQDYPLNKGDAEKVQESLISLYYKKQENAKAHERAHQFLWGGAISTFVLAGTGAPFSSLLLALLDAGITFTSTYIHKVHRRDIDVLYRSLYYSLQNLPPVEIEKEDLREVAILDEQASKYYFRTMIFVVGAGFFWAGPGFRGMRKVYRSMPKLRLRNVRVLGGYLRFLFGTTRTGHLVVSKKSLFDMQLDLMRFLNASIKEVADSAQDLNVMKKLRDQRMWDTHWKPGFRWVPDQDIPTHFPKASKKLIGHYRRQFKLRGTSDEKVWQELITNLERKDAFLDALGFKAPTALFEVAVKKKYISPQQLWAWFQRQTSDEFVSLVRMRGERLWQKAEAAREIARRYRHALEDIRKQSQHAKETLEHELRSATRIAGANQIDDLDLLAYRYRMAAEEKAAKHAEKLMFALDDLDRVLIPIAESGERRSDAVINTQKFLIARIEKAAPHVKRFKDRMAYLREAIKGFFPQMRALQRADSLKDYVPMSALSQQQRNRIAEFLESRNIRGLPARIRAGYHKGLRPVNKAMRLGYAKFGKSIPFWRKEFIVPDDIAERVLIEGGVVMAVMSYFADRTARGVIRVGKGLWEGDSWSEALERGKTGFWATQLDQTAINVVLGIAPKFVSVPIQLSTIPMGRKLKLEGIVEDVVGWATLFPLNGYFLMSTHGLPFRQTLRSLFNPDCILRFGQREAVALTWGRTIAVQRSFLYWTMSGALRAPPIGLGLGTMAMIQFGDKFVNKMAWTAVTVGAHAQGDCDPVVDGVEYIRTFKNPEMARALWLDSVNENGFMDPVHYAQMVEESDAIRRMHERWFPQALAATESLEEERAE